MLGLLGQGAAELLHVELQGLVGILQLLQRSVVGHAEDGDAIEAGEMLAQRSVCGKK